jgi:DNA invertase Pin-like site-specific DNA recombinase
VWPDPAFEAYWWADPEKSPRAGATAGGMTHRRTIPVSTEQATPVAVIAYAAKSSDDHHGSLPTQIAAISEAVGREADREVVAEYRDEAVSAFRKSRGPELKLAVAHAEALANDGQTVELWVAHSDRLARGDGKQAAHLIEHKLWAIKTGVRLRSVADDHSLADLLHAALTGERNNEDSKAKSSHTRRGKRARFENGRSTGPLHYGYRLVPRLDADGRPITERDGRIVYDREPDPEREAIYLRVVALAEQGHSNGAIARALNADGITRKRGGAWASRAIREMLADPYYAGWVRGYGELRDGKHKRLIDRERWQALQAQLARTDPVARRKRRPGRPPSADYLLRGVLTCARCGTGMRTKELADGRHYLCGSVQEARGTCDLPYIAADLLERPALRHLRDGFGLHLEEWITARLADRDQALAALGSELDRERSTLADTERDRDAARKNGADLIARRPDHTERVMDLLADWEERVAEQAKRVQELEDELAGRDEAVSVDSLLDRYREIRELVDGKLRRAKDAPALNAALRSLLAYADIDIDDRGRIAMQFVLAHDPAVFPDGEPFELGAIEAPEWIRRPDYLEPDGGTPRKELGAAPR